MRSKFVTCQAPKPAPRSRRKRREFMGGPCGRRVPRKMADQSYCSAACRQRAHYWGYPVYSDDQLEGDQNRSSASPSPKSVVKTPLISTAYDTPSLGSLGNPSMTAPCIDCGLETVPDDGKCEWYMVRDAVWKKAGMKPWGGCLWIGCLE